MNEEPLFTVITEDESYVFTNTDDFYNFMSENNGRTYISIEKHEN